MVRLNVFWVKKFKIQDLTPDLLFRFHRAKIVYKTDKDFVYFTKIDISAPRADTILFWKYICTEC